ncbi:Spermidine/putrescine import ATP-binding protein PotA (plasmid) [Roseivivax sp. THAF40]|uniref:ATP-binding cassette domain-containing protein n=1 Tax=unclassified Roseivivax TaxID=2639302 RepID=UPI0012682C0A|nr:MULTISPECIES: ATP-binding cassette domain-containing protein [unclassified Roseivivax]QFS84977.1 Spermidine/putrescine import ATP-binding protein PotA [Roseivivax sp. THAF197b]QFT48678.1 Spermidine/putrescine import ATP-binding protein PotA [Roseivivax sp. THAF40]
MVDGLTLENIAITRGGTPIVSLDRHVAPGEVLSVMGPSGVGKSTLLSLVTGTLDPVFSFAGRVLLDGTDITHVAPEARRIGILFQDDLLFPHLSVGANLAFGLSPGGGRGDRARKIEDALEEIGLSGFADRDPATLSGGQKARVALMRMLLSEPRALLLDEAFSGLDADRREQMRRLVFDRARDRGLPVVMVTHDSADAEAAGGPVVTLGG